MNGGGPTPAQVCDWVSKIARGGGDLEEVVAVLLHRVGFDRDLLVRAADLSNNAAAEHLIRAALSTGAFDLPADAQ